jgi:Family of unknown function (DUF6515)
MTTRVMRGTQRCAVFALLVALTASGGTFADDRGHRGGFDHGGPPHQHFDAHFAHNHYYFDRGYRVAALPHTAVAIVYGHDHFWYDRGQWYGRDGAGWVVVGAPLGAFVSVLPQFYTTVQLGGVSYYYADDTYYTWNGDHNEYEVVAPPPGADAAGTAQPPASDSIFVYPKNGQSSEQQSRDEYECYSSARQQTGYDPTQADGGVPPDMAESKRSDYFRADAACLDARGYSVK